MVLLVQGVTGRGEEEYISASNAALYSARAVLSGLPNIGVDFSQRRNPTWYTLGHVSLSYDISPLIWESWLNYLDQAWTFSDYFQTIQVQATELGLPDFLIDGNGETVFTLRWQLRDGISMDFYVGNGVTGE